VHSANQLSRDKIFFTIVLSISVLLAVFVRTSFADQDNIDSSQQASISILNGSQAKGYWPGVVSIQDRFSSTFGGYSGHMCTGTLISSRWVLTAAHCAADKSIRLDVLAKTNNLKAKNPTRRAVVARFIPSEYGKKGSQYDLALLYLHAPIILKKYPEISSETVSPQQTVTALGWGAALKNFPAKLRQIFLSAQENCYGSQLLICAKPAKPKKWGAICSGDSGGPLYDLNKNLVGVSNFSGNSEFRCWHSNYPSGFARLSEFKEWINTQMSRKNIKTSRESPNKRFGRGKAGLFFSN
jgi:secreted trypsin-like serine protease